MLVFPQEPAGKSMMPQPRTASPASSVIRLLSAVLLAICCAGCGGFSLNPFDWGNETYTGNYTGGIGGGRPYTIRGVTYYPLVSARGFRETGIASWYGPGFHGKRTANGERYNMYAMTAAHKLLPMNTTVRVTNLRTGRSIHVRINDRGPFIPGRVIDLSKTAAARLGILAAGTGRVRVEAIDTR